MSLPHQLNSSPSPSAADDLRGEVFDVEAVSKSASRRAKWQRWTRGGAIFALPMALYGAYAFGINNRESNRLLPIGPFPTTKVVPVQSKVYVTGRVKKPGVYALDENARVQDAIQKAGGALPQANLNALNLADWVEDGSKIVVPSLVPVKPTPIPTPYLIVRESHEPPPPRMGAPIAEAPVAYKSPPVVYNPPAPAGNASPPATPNRGAPTVDDGLPRDKTRSGAESSNISPQYLLANPVNINEASAFQLEGLPDIGPRTAERIVAYRAANGRFRSVEELDNVKGIGEKTLARLKPYVVAR